MNLWRKRHKRFSWEEDAISTYDDLGGIGSDEVLLGQCWIDAKKIDLDDYSYISEQDFPWHGYTYDDFVRLHTALQKSIEEVRKCKSRFGVKLFKKRHKEVFNAYFSQPICVYEKDGGSGYAFGRDGRHRIFVAQVCGGLLPVWVVERVEVSEMTRDEYIESYCGGGWRFYEEMNIDEEKIRRIRITE